MSANDGSCTWQSPLGRAYAVAARGVLPPSAGPPDRAGPAEPREPPDPPF